MNPRTEEPVLRVSFGRFALQAVGFTVLLAVAGWWWACSRYGAAGPPAVIVGFGISLLAALVSGWFLSRRSGRCVEADAPAGEAIRGDTALLDNLGAMGIRLLVITGLVVTAVSLGAFEVTPLLLSVAVGYVVLLGLETRFALALVAHRGENGRDPERRDTERPETTERDTAGRDAAKRETAERDTAEPDTARRGGGHRGPTHGHATPRSD